MTLPLSRRTAEPQAGRWALPGRFVGRDESAEEAARALLDEMLPVEGAYIEQLYTFTDVNRNPRGRVISISYLVAAPWVRLEGALKKAKTPFTCFTAEIDGERLSLAGPDGESIRENLAFDHERIVLTGLRRLRGKIEYTDIALSFLNDRTAFTLGELMAVFEAVLGRTLDGGNFRRFVRKRYGETGLIAPTQRAERLKQGRPAAIYRVTEREDCQ